MSGRFEKGNRPWNFQAKWKPTTCEGCGITFTPSNGAKTGKWHSRECYYRHGQRLKPMNAALAPTKSPTLMDIAWAAGIYEGEGTCTGNDQRNAVREGFANDFRVSVTQKDQWLLDRLRECFGGSVGLHQRPKKDRCDMYHWRLSGARGRGFALTVYSLLSPRRQVQIRDAMGLCST